MLAALEANSEKAALQNLQSPLDRGEEVDSKEGEVVGVD